MTRFKNSCLPVVVEGRLHSSSLLRSGPAGRDLMRQAPSQSSRTTGRLRLPKSTPARNMLVPFFSEMCFEGTPPSLLPSLGATLEATRPLHPPLPGARATPRAASFQTGFFPSLSPSPPLNPLLCPPSPCPFSPRFFPAANSQDSSPSTTIVAAAAAAATRSLVEAEAEAMSAAGLKV